MGEGVVVVIRGGGGGGLGIFGLLCTDFGLGGAVRKEETGRAEAAVVSCLCSIVVGCCFLMDTLVSSCGRSS